MKLFALVANVNKEGKASNERNIVIEFLQQQFNNELVNVYIEYFDRQVLLYNQVTEEDKKIKGSGRSIDEKLKEICDQINEELQFEQKIIILINLLDYVNEDKKLTSKELWFVDHAAEYLKVEKHEYNDLKAFSFDRNDDIIHKENLLLIDSIRNNDLKIKHIYNRNFDGGMKVLHCLCTNTFILRCNSNETLLLNGHNIKNNRSYIWSTGSVVQGQKLGSIYYTWISGKFIQAKTKSKFVFVAKDIEFSYGNSPNGVKRFTLTEESGRLIGIIGGSGCGKSTLLKVLCGNLKPKRGKITINGLDIHADHEQLKGIIGFVPQDDFLIKELTVFQNLYYNARLSFNNYSEKQILKVVEKSLVDFDLYEARDLQVGDSLNTFLSGGQRKRLNIALELMREPSILFVDEPTSGLSSADSEKVIQLLKKQTFKGKLVFANIHQPSSDNFKQFDKLLVMDQGGHVIYYGNPVDAITYFKRMTNCVDAEERECMVCGNINTDQILRNVEARVVDVNGRLTRKRKTSPEEWYDLYMENIDPVIKKIKRSYSTILPETDFKVPSRWQQLKIFFIRDVLAKFTNKQYLLLTLLEAPILALILAFITKSSRSITGVSQAYIFGENINIPGYLFMSVIVALFLGMVISAEEIFRDRKILEREKFLNLSRSSYLNAKVFVMLIISALQMITFVLLGNYLLEIKGMDWRFFLILFFTACWANMIGLNISAGFNSVVTIYILVPLILIPQLLLSGVVIDFRNMNNNVRSEKYVPVLGDIITSRWAYEGLMVTQFKDNRFEKHFYNEDQAISTASYIKSYLIPELRDLNNECLQNIGNNKMYDKTSRNLRIITKELDRISSYTGIRFGKLIDSLHFESYSPSIHQQLSEILDRAEMQALGRYRAAVSVKDKIFERMKSTLGGIDNFVSFRKTYRNRKVASLVINEEQIYEYSISDKEIIRIKDAIYWYPESRFGRAQYFAPVKRIGVLVIDTFWFNILNILMWVFLLYLVLYFNLLNKLIRYIENFRLRRFSRRRFLRLLKQSEIRQK